MLLAPLPLADEPGRDIQIAGENRLAGILLRVERGFDATARPDGAGRFDSGPVRGQFHGIKLQARDGGNAGDLVFKGMTESIKLATNTPMYERLEEDMDLNCGEILDKGVSVEEMGERIFRMFLAVASGEPSKSEALGLGDNEFVHWLVGAVM